MSDSTTLLPQVSQSAIQREAAINANFDEASPAMLFGRLATTTALTWAYQGGRYNGTQFANGTVALTAANTNYVVVHLTTLAVTASTSNTNWNDSTTYGRAYLVVAGASTITSYQDHRAGTLGILSATATGGPPSGAAGGDLTGTYPNPTVGANKVGVAKMAATQTDVFFGRDTAGAGAGEEITVAAAKTLLGLTGTNSGDQTITLTGDVTGSGTSSFAATIAAAAVTLAKMANLATARFIGRTTAGTGVPEALTGTQATAMLDALVGDSGSGGTKGLAPAPGAGDAAAGKFLKADATYAVPAGGAPSGAAGGDLAGTYPNPTVKASVSLTTPALNVATATSINKVAITAPATSATLTVADGKTLTASNTLTLAGTDSTTMTFPPASASVGYLNVPQNSQSTAYTTVLADAGKHLLHPSADTTARTFTIDSNANVAFAIGTAITFVNQASAGVMTIAITSDTMRLAGAGTTGSRTLAANGVATALKLTSTEWIVSGTGLT